MNYKVILASFILLFSLNGYTKQVEADLTIDDFKPLIISQDIQRRVKEVAAQINHDYEGKHIVLIMVMKGAICFASDLAREITVPCTIEYVQASSYGQNGMQAGALTLRGIETLDLTGKDVLLVDDIFDTGVTITRIKAELQKYNPASIKTAIFLLKNKQRAMKEVPEYVAFAIENQFVIGYGLDYKELFRGLPEVWVKKD